MTSRRAMNPLLIEDNESNEQIFERIEVDNFSYFLFYKPFYIIIQNLRIIFPKIK